MASEVKVLRAMEAEDHARAPLLCDGERDSEELDCLSTTAATADGSKHTPGEGTGADGEALSSSQATADAELEGTSLPSVGAAPGPCMSAFQLKHSVSSVLCCLTRVRKLQRSVFASWSQVAALQCRDGLRFGT